MIDFNSSEFPGVAFLRVELSEQYEFTDETFGVYCNQQGDVLGGVRKFFNPHVQVTIDTLVIGPENEIVFDSKIQDNPSYSNFFTEPKTM